MFKDLKTDYYSTLDSVEKEEWDIFFRKKLRYKQPKLMTQKQINEIKEAERQQQEMGFEESAQQDRNDADNGFGFDQGFTNQLQALRSWGAQLMNLSVVKFPENHRHFQTLD